MKNLLRLQIILFKIIYLQARIITVVLSIAETIITVNTFIR